MCDDNKKKNSWTLEYIDECILNYCKYNNGKWPYASLKDIIKNDERKWSSINIWLNRNFNMSLSERCIFLGKPKIKTKQIINIEDIDKYILEYRKSNQKWPTRIKGNINISTDLSISWSLINFYLKTRYNSSLSERCVLLGKTKNKKLSLEYIDECILKYYNDNNNKWPANYLKVNISQNDTRKWYSIEFWLKRYNSSISKRCLELGKKQYKYDDEYLKEIIIKFKLKTKMWPCKRDFKKIIENDGRTWGSINSYLQNKNTTLNQFCKSLGKIKAENKEPSWTLEYIEQCINSFYLENKKYPNTSSGLIKKDTRNWKSVNLWLRRNYNTTLNQKCKNLGKLSNKLVDRFPELIIEFSNKNNVTIENINIGSDNMYIWICQKCYNEYKASPHNRCKEDENGTGCPKCKINKGEKQCTKILEKLTGKIFKKTRPKWLKNYKTNHLLELDGYCEDLKIAYEYQGPQHYMIINTYKMNKNNLKYQKYKDKIKIKLCKENNVKLIIIPYWIKDLEEFILSELKRLEIPIILTNTGNA